MAAIGIKCFGKVQGVFFRATTKTRAENLGIRGWVRNEPDGTVLIHAEGEQANVMHLLDWCQTGPEFAQVDRVESWDTKNEDFSSFEIRR